MIFDSHAHYNDEKFSEDRDLLLSSMRENGIGYIVNVGSDIHATADSIALAEAYDFIYAAAGVHPSDIACLDETTFAWLRDQLSHPKVVAVGEIGLDYYWDKEPEVRELQKVWFRRQLDLAREANLPVIIHSRDAAEDTLKMMKEAHAEGIPGVIHCFSYSKELAMEYVKMGYYIGIGGVVTFNNAKKLKEVAAVIPMEHMLLETDCPYLSPVPYRGKRNSSLYLPYVVEQIASLREMTAEEVIEITECNARRFYRIM